MNINIHMDIDNVEEIKLHRYHHILEYSERRENTPELIFVIMLLCLIVNRIQLVVCYESF